MKKRKTNSKFFRLLVIASILVWVFVIIVSLLTLQIRGGLKPHAAGDIDLMVVASGRVVDINEVGVGYAKLVLGGDFGKRYIFADSQGYFYITDVAPGDYSILIEAKGYRAYESTVNLSGSDQYSFTLHKEGTKNDPVEF